MGNSKDKIKHERSTHLILLGLKQLLYVFNYLLLTLICKRVGCNVKVIELPKVSGGKNITIGDNVFIGRGVHFAAPDDSSIAIGSGSQIRDGVRLYAHHIVIESDVTIGENAFLVGTILAKQGSWISRGCDLTGDIVIGKAILGPHVSCVSGDHARADSGAVLMDIAGASGKIAIEDGSWIGTRAVILKAVTVGKNSIVGAGSVVTKPVAAGAVVAGVPAKEIATHTSTSVPKH